MPSLSIQQPSSSINQEGGSGASWDHLRRVEQANLSRTVPRAFPPSPHSPFLPVPQGSTQILFFWGKSPYPNKCYPWCQLPDQRIGLLELSEPLPP